MYLRANIYMTSLHFTTWMYLVLWNMQRMKLENDYQEMLYSSLWLCNSCKVLKRNQASSTKLLNKNPVFQSFFR